jgi:hypothetical protein
MTMTRAEANAAKAELTYRLGRPAIQSDTGAALHRICYRIMVADPPPPDDAVAFLALTREAADEWIALTVAIEGHPVLGPVLTADGWLYAYDLRPALARRRGSQLPRREQADETPR